jgi:hypothetical protein
VIIASPDGEVTRYIYGFDFPPKQMKLSLLDASEGGSPESLGDKLLHYCYRFDPRAGAYTMEAMAVMRIAGGRPSSAWSSSSGGCSPGRRRKKRLGSPRTPPGPTPTATTDDSGTHGHPSAGHASPTPA